MLGNQYSKSSFDFYNNVLPAGEGEFRYLALKLSHYIQLMLRASNRGNPWKMRVVFNALQDSFQALAEGFRLVDGIHTLLIDSGDVAKRKYRVSDLRKFPDYARIIGFKDDRRLSPNRIVAYNRPNGWLPNYYLIEKPVLPPDVEMKLRPNTEYLIDEDRPLPQALREIMDQALYWEIEDFRWRLGLVPQKA